MIESGGIAPYAPKKAVMSVICAYRDDPISTPIDLGVMKRIGVTASIAPRTQQALKLLDLIDAKGNPTPAMEGLRKAGSDEFRSRLAEVVRAAYAEILTYRDPVTDDVTKIEDAFRHFQPVSMRHRMARLFLGLCEEAGIIEAAGRVSSTASKTVPTVRKKHATTSVSQAELPVERPPPLAVQGGPSALPIAGSDHLVIRGLLQTLPPVGTVWPDERRKEWTAAVMAAFNLIYKRPANRRPELEPDLGGGDG